MTYQFVPVLFSCAPRHQESFVTAPLLDEVKTGYTFDWCGEYSPLKFRGVLLREEGIVYSNLWSFSFDREDYNSEIGARDEAGGR
jgi:hypothetical protein